MEKTYEYKGKFHDIVENMDNVALVHMVKEMGHNVMCEMLDYLSPDDDTHSGLDRVLMRMTIGVVQEFFESSSDGKTEMAVMLLSHLYNGGIDELREAAGEKTAAS